MADGSGTGAARYRAFISYSHRDAVFAARLHRRLEGYVLPKRLGAGRRLTPIFKDREELPAAQDLSAQVRAALAVSECLIVVCSPDAAASPWVGREIDLFRELRPERPILAALAQGEPGEAFPPALAAGRVEPLAADFRKAADGERLALLKLVAGIACVGVDQLIQRDAQRRLRSVMAVTGVALALVLAMAGLTAFAMSARAEAERQRAEAEKLVDFMLTGLREDLKAVGRLPVMAAVNAKALAYFSAQDLASLPVSALEKRARLLHAMGEDDAAQDRFEPARAQFREAFRTTSALLKAAPDNPDRVYSHAQSAYWVGYIDYRQNRTAEARQALETYRNLAGRLRSTEPGSVRSYQEIASAEGNLCALAVEQERALKRALATCDSALANAREALALNPGSVALAKEVATRWAWLANVQTGLGQFARARESRLAQREILAALLARDPDNADLRDSWGVCHRGLSLIAYRQGDLPGAVSDLQVARSTFRALVSMDPTNSRWREQAAYADHAISRLRAKKKE